VADGRRREHPFSLRNESDAIRERLEAGDRRKRGRAAVTGQVRDKQTVPSGQEWSELDPVGGRPSEPVDEQERRAASVTEDDYSLDR
jgi:hypothetical protein